MVLVKNQCPPQVGLPYFLFPSRRSELPLKENKFETLFINRRFEDVVSIELVSPRINYLTQFELDKAQRSKTASNVGVEKFQQKSTNLKKTKSPSMISSSQLSRFTTSYMPVGSEKRLMGFVGKPPAWVAFCFCNQSSHIFMSA